MNRDELAKELNIQPWDIDNWLLLGCPARKIRSQWIFDMEEVRSWLRIEKIKMKRMGSRPLPQRPLFDQRWFGERCPICADRGFAGEKGGRLYILGEVFEGQWHLRRTGVPCGHSQNLNYIF